MKNETAEEFGFFGIRTNCLIDISVWIWSSIYISDVELGCIFVIRMCP